MGYYRSVSSGDKALKVSELQEMIAEREEELIELKGYQDKLLSKANFRS